jgi:hypothetical protein
MLPTLPRASPQEPPRAGFLAFFSVALSHGALRQQQESEQARDPPKWWSKAGLQHQKRRLPGSQEEYRMKSVIMGLSAAMLLAGLTGTASAASVKSTKAVMGKVVEARGYGYGRSYSYGRSYGYGRGYGYNSYRGYGYNSYRGYYNSYRSYYPSYNYNYSYYPSYSSSYSYYPSYYGYGNYGSYHHGYRGYYHGRR